MSVATACKSTAKAKAKTAVEPPCAVVVRGKEANTICQGDQKLIVMTGNCKTLAKGDHFFLVVKHSDKDFHENHESPCQAQDPKHMFKLVAQLEFVANRRYSEEKLLSHGQLGQHGLPGTRLELESLKKDLGLINDKKKTFCLWEVSLSKVASPPHCLSKAMPRVDSGSGNASAFRPLPFNYSNQDRRLTADCFSTFKHIAIAIPLYYVYI